MTAGSMARSLLKHLPELFSSDGCEPFAAFQALIAPLSSPFQGRHLFGCGAVFPLGVIGGFDIDLAERDNIGAANNADILTPRRRRQPPTEILLGVGDC